VAEIFPTMSRTSIAKADLHQSAAVTVLTVIDRRTAETVADAVDVPAAVVVEIVDAAVGADVPVAAVGIVADAVALAAAAGGTKPLRRIYADRT
jgi:hypothetical protein